MDNRLKIINYVGKHTNESFTMHELSKLITVPYATFHRTVETMKDLLIIHIIGKAKTISLNKDHPTLKSYLAISSEEEKITFLRNQPIINKISTEISTDDCVLLFGSYAKGSEHTSSDIDLLIINQKGNKTLSFSKYETLFKKNINPIFITKSEFITMIHDKDENVGKQALKNHVILKNPELFWEYVLHG